MKTLRFRLPVLDLNDEQDFLDIVTSVRGVIAAVVDETTATLEVVVRGDACALLVQRQVQDALLAGMASAVEA